MKQDRWRQVEELFHAAVERAPEERQAFLQEVCGEDAELRHQVENLVSIDRRAGSHLETQAIEEVSSAQDTTLPVEAAQVGPYRILAPLGAGGMGTVYRARDTKLGRDVAIKTLPSEFAHNPERLARLRLEARTLASLNHPNIAAIYGLEEFGDSDWLILELVEGQNLRGPLPVPEALRTARQIAEALEAAHEKGIVHRDLKPANVRVTHQGRVKVLDFGLAKAGWVEDPRQPGRNPDVSRLPTETTPETVADRIMGTPGYMSPEQARGRKVDHRADIWAFGCVLYELLTGERAFGGKTQTETLAAVLEREPEWRFLPPETPEKVRELLRQCLQKDADRRPVAIADVRRTIEEAQGGRNPWRVASIAASALAIVAIAAVLWLRGPEQPPDRSRWVKLTEFPDPVSQPALSPDGKMVAFLRSPGTFFGVGQVYVKRLPDGDPRRLTNDNFAKNNPEFLPDGVRIAYTTVDSGFTWDTWIVSITGGESQRWLHNVSDLTWAGPRQVLYSERPRKIIVSAGQDLRGRNEVYIPSNDRGVARRPRASPDGKWVLLAELGAYGDWEPCRVVPMDGSTPGRKVGPPGAACTGGTWSPDGHWIYLSSKAGGVYHIWRQRFPDGEPQQFTSGPTEEEGVAIAPDGKSLVTAVTLQSASIWLHGAHGERQISRLEGNAAYARFTPDGRKVCYRLLKEVPSPGSSTYRDLGELWVADLDSGSTEPLVPSFPVHDYDISPDGSQVVVEADDHEGKPRLWLVKLKGRSAPQRIPNAEGRQAVFGSRGEIYFRHIEGQSGFAYRIEPDGTGLRKAIEQPLLAVTGASPDGRWIEGWAPLPESGAPAVQLFPLDGGSPLVVGSNAWLRWSPDGRTLWMEGGPIPTGKTYIIPVALGESPPRIPPRGFHAENEVARLPGALRIEETGAPGPSPDVYVFDRRTIQRNLYRIPIP